VNVVLISIVIFLLTLAASYAGLEVQKRLKDEHKTGESKGVVGQVAGLLTLLLALVLGTLIGVSYAYYSTQKTELEGFSAQVLRLDQALGQYGPETKPLRDRMKAGIVKAYETFWGGGEVDSSLLTVEAPLANAQAIGDFLATLQPKTDQQKQALATAVLYNGMVEQSRLLMSLQVASGPVSWVLIAILVFWTVALRHRPLRRAKLPGHHRPGVRRSLDRLRDLPHPRARPPLHRPAQGFARRARGDDRVHRQVG
jgi:hypothetical protein